MAELNIQEHFQVPEGYFENLAEQVMKALPEQNFQPMVGVPAETKAQKRRIIPLWTRYAAAACVAGVVMVSAFTAFYSGADKTAVDQQDLAAVTTTTITTADSSKEVKEAVVSETAVEKHVLAKAEPVRVHGDVAVKGAVTKADAPVRQTGGDVKVKKASSHQSYDIDVNVGYDVNDMERAAMYMGIDHQTMCEMMYEEL